MPSRRHFGIPHGRRTDHIAILGKTGAGKSSLLRWFCGQDITGDRGFVYFDLHGDATPFLLRKVALEERKRQRDLSDRVIVIDPADPEWSVGVNILQCPDESSTFVQAADFTELLKNRWHLDVLGARTEELLRNSLYVLTRNYLTLLEMAPFLTNRAFRASCVKKAGNHAIREYFETRYDTLAEGMQITVREPILNKISAFTTDLHFRHVLGQQHSTFWLDEVMQRGAWVIVNLDKGRLGQEATTFGGLFLGMIKSALFARRRRDLFTLYCDEIQNLVAYDSGLDTILSEARKFGVSVVSANQFLDQYPPNMRSAILAVGTHAFFQLASQDASVISAALDGGRTLAKLLKNLPQRTLVVKSGSDRWQEVYAPRVTDPEIAYADLYRRSRERWARKRGDVERDIVTRYASFTRGSDPELHDW